MKFSFLKTTNPYLNLAIEEYLLKYTDNEYFLLWQNEPTVVIGKNQNVFAEINLDFIRENKIHIARRITGGGAVYHDLGNLNYSFISNEAEDGIDFEKFSSPVISALKEMGICAGLSGRNDIMIGDKKISGNAQTHYKGRVLHHGTLLFDSDIDMLSAALSVENGKFKSKAIKSTRAAVTNIKPYLPGEYTVFDFAQKIKNSVLSKNNGAEFDIELNDKIKCIEMRNADKSWIFPDKDYLSRFTVSLKKRYDYGTVALFFNMKNDIITDFKIEGDYFGTKEISLLEDAVKGKSVYNIEDVISDIKISDFIFGMTNEEFLKLLKTIE